MHRANGCTVSEGAEGAGNGEKKGSDGSPFTAALLGAEAWSLAGAACQRSQLTACNLEAHCEIVYFLQNVAF